MQEKTLVLSRLLLVKYLKLPNNQTSLKGQWSKKISREQAK
jgi:hypothetical protein